MTERGEGAGLRMRRSSARQGDHVDPCRTFQANREKAALERGKPPQQRQEEAALATLLALGMFTEAQCKEALQKASGRAEQAAELLLNGGV